MVLERWQALVSAHPDLSSGPPLEQLSEECGWLHLSCWQASVREAASAMCCTAGSEEVVRCAHGVAT